MGSHQHEMSINPEMNYRFPILILNSEVIKKYGIGLRKKSGGGGRGQWRGRPAKGC